VVVLTGARQTGKTSTFLRLFPKHAFVSLDLPAEAEQAEKEPSTFLQRHPPLVSLIRRILQSESPTFQMSTLNPHLERRTDLSRAGTFLFALFFVGLIRSASMGSGRVETAINHASNPNSSPLAGLISPNT